MIKVNVLIFLIKFITAEHIQQPIGYVQACSNPEFFCHGEVLRKVQMSGIFNDSKTFVDMAIRSVNRTDEIKSKILRHQSQEELQETVMKYFQQAGEELHAANVSESHEEPEIIRSIKSLEYRHWAKTLCALWDKLVRQMDKDVGINPAKYSLLFMKKPFVVPGGRFRELYYWDTYWSLEGLLLCRKINTSKNILENLINLVKENGFIPNGGRKYYKNRSQPPFLTLMVEKYWRHTMDNQFVKDNFNSLVKEHRFWMKERSMNVTSNNSTFLVNLYNCKMGFPRPESYKEDVQLMREAGYEHNQTSQMELYAHIASAAESGWDFSSRWFKHSHQLSSIQTRNIIPVDLNTILCMVEFSLAKLAREVMNDSITEKYFYDLATQRRLDIDKFFWDEEYGLWLDYNFHTKLHTQQFYASNFFPLWIWSKDATSGNKTRAIMAYKKLQQLGVFNYIGGVPTSLLQSGQQWDFPNAWPPLQYVAVHALSNIGDFEANNTAKMVAKKYLETAYISWKRTGHMYEKYDVTRRAVPGHGGEYEVQDGFGWTNGVALNLLNMYGDQLVHPAIDNKEHRVFPNHYLIIFFFLIVLLQTQIV